MVNKDVYNMTYLVTNS